VLWGYLTVSALRKYPGKIDLDPGKSWNFVTVIEWEPCTTCRILEICSLPHLPSISNDIVMAVLSYLTG